MDFEEPEQRVTTSEYVVDCLVDSGLLFLLILTAPIVTAVIHITLDSIGEWLSD